MREREREPRDSLAEVDVQVVERTGADLDDDLARPRDRIGHGFDDELVASTELVEPQRLHVASRDFRGNKSDDCSPASRACASTAIVIATAANAPRAQAPSHAARQPA